ncbi:hypothetical protein SDJN03_23346, partial [Cucurbita argyrosperma subsp. sororia]
MGYSTANLMFGILVASIALRLPLEARASAMVGPSPLPPPTCHSPSGQLLFRRPIKVSLTVKASGEDEAEAPSSKDEKGRRKPWPKQPVPKAPPPPF